MNQPTKHHRKPSSKGGNGDPRNISIVEKTQHEAWHTLFRNYDPEAICQIINEVWLDPDFYFICIRKGGKNDRR